MTERMTEYQALQKRDHGGGLDAAVAQFGATHSDWIDLSTGINPVPYPLPEIPSRFWQTLPGTDAQDALKSAARSFWHIPEQADIIAASGVSSLIAALPRLLPASTVGIAEPTYNEFAASFSATDWTVTQSAGNANVYVHPNNPDGRLWSRDEILANHKTLTIIDESFCDTCPDETHIDLAAKPGFVILKGFGKFWGLAGMRLGFAAALRETTTELEHMLGPWSISGPAQHIGHTALSNMTWAAQTRCNLAQSAERLDDILLRSGAQNPRGTTLFRLYDVADAQAWFERLAQAQILSRIFAYSNTLIRLGLPNEDIQWSKLTSALE